MKILRFFALAILITFASATQILALEANKETIKDAKLFGIEFPDGTSYYGRSDKIVSVSKQQYLVGPIIVTEVNIEMENSRTQLRIYNSRAIPSEMAANLAIKKTEGAANYAPPIPAVLKKIDEKAGNLATQQKVYKDYPQTTHAKTLEFIVPNIEELEKFYKQISSDFLKLNKESVSKKIYIIKDK